MRRYPGAGTSVFTNVVMYSLSGSSIFPLQWLKQTGEKYCSVDRGKWTGEQSSELVIAIISLRSAGFKFVTLIWVYTNLVVGLCGLRGLFTKHALA